ncbi:MAG: ATP synthase F1 subunit epsilon [Magnetococcales bacterium]|nr:ATP synthase F1 subunit epsilon [Magnetococcales bacterium]
MSIVIRTELVTPEALVLSEEFMLVTAPGVEGYFGVMSGHAPFVTLLKPGVLSLGEDEDAKVFVVAGGFVEVMPDKMIILTERALPRDQITEQQIQSELKEAHLKLADPDLEPSASAFWQNRIEFAQVCQELLKKQLA